MKTIFTPFVCCVAALLSAPNCIAQLLFTVKSEQAILTEFARANGDHLPELTTSPLQSMVYITIDNSLGRVYAATNFSADTTDKKYNIMLLQGGMLDSAELRSLFEGAEKPFNVTRLPLLIHNDVFRVFLDTKFLQRYPNVSVVSERGQKFPLRRQYVEIRPGLLLQPAIGLDDFSSFLFERRFDPAQVEALSLLNNKAVNEALAAVFPDFQAIRTEDHIEKAFSQSRKKSIYLFAHLDPEGNMVRYRSSGEMSYKLPATQFLHLGSALHKEVILIGINYSDDTSRTLDVEAQVKTLETALQNRSWGIVLQSLAGTNSVQVTELNTDGIYFKRAEVAGPEGLRPARVYSFIFFKTPPKPAVFIEALRFLFRHSGKFLAALVVLQLMFFFVLKGRYVKILRWVNWFLLGIFLFVLLFSIL